VNKFSYVIFTLIMPLSILSQQNSGYTGYDSDFKTLVSLGGGVAIGRDYPDGINATANFSFLIEPHLGKGYYIGAGFNHHGIPRNTDNKATYTMLYFTKGFYLMRKFGFYAGLGGTLGVTSRGHPGCCVGGAYLVVSAIYDVQKYLALGMNTQLITDFDELTVFPGIRISVRF
jgi:hypothetical protein